VSLANRLRVISVVLLGGTAALAANLPWGHPGWFGLPILAIAVGVCETALINVTVARQRVTFSLTDGVVAAAFLLAPGWWSVVAVLGGLLPVLLITRKSALKVQYNITQYFVSTTVAALVVVRLDGGVHGGVGPALVGMAVWWFCNQVLSAIPLSIMGGERFVSMIFEDAGLQSVHAAATTSIGVLGAWLAVHAPFGLLGLLVPVLVLWMSFDEQTTKSAEARLFAELARGQEQAISHSIDVSARVVLTAAARVLGGADVELVVVEHEGPVVYTGDESGRTHRRNDAEAFDAPWVLRALGAGGVLTGTDAERPFCSAVIGTADQPMAVLIAHRPAGGNGFGRRESGLASVLVGQAKSWLSVAELSASRDEALARADAADMAARSLGDIGADTAPALGMLRESATRLARLATESSGEEGVTDIVDELHSVERAVASLLGAIALAADPTLRELETEMDDALPARRVEDWTTTGLVVKSELVR
jgi:hypothetical protein